jgi:exopolysaccharide biosynthesis predicted pyruvyltransferase EpsI
LTHERIVIASENLPAREDSYLEFLRERAGKTFHVMAYPGNAGDALIRFATDQILADLQIRTASEPAKAEVILVPGGNPTLWPDIGAERWQSIWARHSHAEFVVGPAGFRDGYSDWARIVNEHGSTVTGLFARDPEGFRCLQAGRLRSGITYGLAYDPALYLRTSEWIAAHRRAASKQYDLAVFRNDRETNLPYPGAWRALSSVVPKRFHRSLTRALASPVRRRKLRMAGASREGEAFPLICRDVAREPLDAFVDAVRAARTVHTDRLHTMLLATMLGKEVFAYPTSHSKLEGVYEYALKGWADVTFVAM